MKNLLEDSEIPIGFSMALAKDLTAMNQFSNLGEAQQKQVIQQAHQIQSKSEMQQFVSKLSESAN